MHPSSVKFTKWSIFKGVLQSHRRMISHARIPMPTNEPLREYPPGSLERSELLRTLDDMRTSVERDVPCVIDGVMFRNSTEVQSQNVCSDHQNILCKFYHADDQMIQKAIDGAISAGQEWSRWPFQDRAAVFLRAAELLTSSKYRSKVLAATILGQGKNIWQAEIDAIAELADFWRFNCLFAEEIHNLQPTYQSKGIWNSCEYGPLDGFVTAITPFNFTAIGANLSSAPALMGNAVLWKPSGNAIYSNYLVYTILMEAGLPPGVIQFLPANPQKFSKIILNHRQLGGIHFTGSTAVFEGLWRSVGENVSSYTSFPRLVGETGGKNFHIIHDSALQNYEELTNVVNHTIRAAFEYQGQKCSAASRLYVPRSKWPLLREKLSEQVKILIDDQRNENKKAEFLLCGALINRAAFERVTGYINRAKQNPDVEVVIGGGSNDKLGYFVEPTILLVKDPKSETMVNEIFGPVLSVFLYDDFGSMLDEISVTGRYGLTGSM